MAEKDPRREVRTYPERTRFMDGLNYRFMNMGGVPTIDREGRRVIKFRLQTDEVTRKAYEIKKGECDDENCVEITVNENDIIWLNKYDEARRMILYVKTFRGDNTDLSEREAFWKGEAQKKDAKILQREAEVLALREENNTIKTNPFKFMKQYGDMSKDMMSGLAEALMKKKDEIS